MSRAMVPKEEAQSSLARAPRSAAEALSGVAAPKARVVRGVNKSATSWADSLRDAASAADAAAGSEKPTGKRKAEDMGLGADELLAAEILSGSFGRAPAPAAPAAVPWATNGRAPPAGRGRRYAPTPRTSCTSHVAFFSALARSAARSRVCGSLHAAPTRAPRRKTRPLRARAARPLRAPGHAGTRVRPERSDGIDSVLLHVAIAVLAVLAAVA